MPSLALGTWPMDNDETAHAVESALATGYRHIDTAENYRNEEGVGEGLRRSGIAREEVFITTKFNKEWHSLDGVNRAFANASQRLGVDYIDLFMIHWPNPEQDAYVEAFHGLQSLLEAGKVRAIGVSNFKPVHLNRLLAAGMVPAVNQIQLDPERASNDVLGLHELHGIATVAYSPLGRGGGFLQDPAITDAAAAHGKTPTQIALRWHMSMGFGAAPKSADRERQAQNIEIFDFELSTQEMDRIATLDRAAPPRLDSDEFGH